LAVETLQIRTQEITRSWKERGGADDSGLLRAMDGPKQAHMDVLVACPESCALLLSAPKPTG